MLINTSFVLIKETSATTTNGAETAASLLAAGLDVRAAELVSFLSNFAN